MRILFLTDNFPPEVNAPASRTFEHCRAWVQAGADVTVITGAPNFPTGRVFAGYRNRLIQREAVDGVKVVRVWTYMAPNSGVLRRTLDFLSFMIAATVVGLFVRRPNVIVATSPQIFTACAGRALGAVLGVPFVFELRDLWPASIRAVGAIRNNRVIALLEQLELFLYRGAAAIVALTHAYRDNLVARGVRPERITVVRNGVDLARFSPRPRDPRLEAELGLAGKFVAGYIGTHGAAHALETLLEAAAILQACEEASDVRLLLVGDGAARDTLVARAAAMGLRNVLFVASAPRDEVARYWALLDVSITHLKRDPLFSTVVPSKLFESMAMGVPVLHGVAGESAALVESEGVGVMFPSEEPGALADAILTLAHDPERRHTLSIRCRAAAARHDRTRLALQMLEVLKRTVSAAAREGRAAGILAHADS